MVQQLAIIAASLAAYEVFKKRNIKVDFLSGLSLGEYTCLYPAGVLSLKDLIYLIRMRAEVTEHVSDLCPSSMLAVVGLDRSQLMLEGERQGFYIANINSPQQMVVSLKQEEKARVKNSLEDLGAKVIELDVTGGFHSPLMEPVKQQFKKFIDKLEFKKAKIPIVSNVTAMAHTDKSEIKSNLTEEMTSPVLWRDCVDFMLKGGVDIFFEIGPSQIVRGLIKKINPGVNIVNLEKKDDFEKLVQYQ